MILLILAPALAAAPAEVDCSGYRGVAPYISVQPKVARQGGTMTPNLMYVPAPGRDPELLPAACATGWRVKGKGVKLVRRSRGTAVQIRIAPQAIPGSRVTLQASFAGKRAYGGFTVIGTEQQVLAGRFQVVEQRDCLGPEIAEMHFFPSGHYNYTRPEAMIETMTSGEGWYRLDSESGRMEISISNQPFEARQHGTARWIHDRLVLDGIDPGGPSLPPEIASNYPVCHLVLANG